MKLLVMPRQAGKTTALIDASQVQVFQSVFVTTLQKSI